MAKLKENLKKKVGSRRQVWNRTAKQTPGGLKRKDLYKDKIWKSSITEIYEKNL